MSVLALQPHAVAEVRERVFAGRRCCKSKKLLNTCLAPSLNYETSYGGLVSSQIFTTIDVNADFVYNDPHYHYGYWMTASAMLKIPHPKWKRMKELDAMTCMILRNVANLSTDDAFFPKSSHVQGF
ncbi:hypothetical protein PHYPSEUDO_001921 [Phytophthora pseudosyringae]|uniref:glucan endo-1,3-beta-D-glucosidase n=1 Tax=Phytophthora pseudosyringae TaxID=221518 RepID=A0A8T1VYL3_9STRA|nr:hypothetical protein PHYPSEUDO_001921 [Phytophthora pseudosyringae]